MKRNVAILVFDDVEVLDFAGPFEVFAVADELHERTAFHTFTLALKPGTTYEWYADVNSCGSRATSPLYRFTTMASARAANELGRTLDQPQGRERTKRVTSGPVDPQPDDPSLAD